MYLFNCTKGNVVSFGKTTWKWTLLSADISFYLKSSLIIKSKRVRGLERKIPTTDNKVTGIHAYNLRSWTYNKLRNRWQRDKKLFFILSATANVFWWKHYRAVLCGLLIVYDHGITLGLHAVIVTITWQQVLLEVVRGQPELEEVWATFLLHVLKTVTIQINDVHM